MIKTGVDLRNLTPQMALAYTEACWVYYKTGGYECVITSAFDGVHSANSLHSRDGLCRALDLRTQHLSADDRVLIVQRIKIALGPQFDVVMEDVGLSNEHAHVEFQPKDETGKPLEV